MIYVLGELGPIERAVPYCPVLSQAVWRGDEIRSRQLWADYASSAEANLWLQHSDGEMAGVIGFIAGADAVVIRHLAVIPRLQRQGIGRALVMRVAAATGKTVVAETDADGIGFYERCKFEIVALPNRASTVPRFRCILSCIALNPS